MNPPALRQGGVLATVTRVCTWADEPMRMSDRSGDTTLTRSTRRAAATAPSGMLAYLKRTTIKLPDSLDVRLRLEAKLRGITISELTREAIETHLGEQPRRRLLAAGAGSSGHSDVSERIEEILTREWKP